MKSTSDANDERACRDRLSELFDYIDGELTMARCRTLERHLASCACCGTLANNLRQAIALCRAEGRRQLPKAVRARAQERVRALLARATPASER